MARWLQSVEACKENLAIGTLVRFANALKGADGRVPHAAHDGEPNARPASTIIMTCDGGARPWLRWRTVPADARLAVAMGKRSALDGVIEPEVLFRTLRSLAMKGIAATVADLDREGKNVREYAYLFFDARPPSLVRLAVTLLQLDEKVSAQQAEREFERAAAKAKREGHLLGAGGVLPPDLLLIALADVSAPGTSLALVEDWLAKPFPPDHMRLVMLAETKLSLEHVPLVRAN